MFRIKICGVTNPADAAHAAACGADAIGINFYRGSRRFVPEDSAREIVRAVTERALVVGVFVNEPPGSIAGICGRLGIAAVQLHGDEPAEEASRLPFWRLKAVHATRPVDLEALAAYPCEAFLLDAGGPGGYGGTGVRLAWEGLSDRFPGALARNASPGIGKPWVLAGGLTPENVERAVTLAKPFAVDTASGVESSPGIKDPGKVAAFIERAKKGFQLAGT
ncbi:MAG: phosphoribosylanthranilate isomerase [Deltaproteobacteria bacterium]|nr:phosphoribosylanthranilate isomerase [Deltaproteobacteria bacterium]